MKKIVVEFIPILAITLFALYTKPVIEFSHTILGKLLALFVIMIYTLIDKWWGLFVCAIVIFYYQLFVVEGMEPRVQENMDTPSHVADSEQTHLVKEFQQEHCEQGSLKYKDMDVKSEMADHIFPEIEYRHESNKCNPCDSACYYSIVAKKINTENNMTKPKNSKDDMDWLQQIFGENSATNTVGAIGTVSEPFSFL
jgi:hypothetical protein